MIIKEIIESNGIKNVSEKTKISIRNLNYFLNQDFDSLGRIKGLGFLNILEQRYNTSLEIYREELKEYFESSSSPIDNNILNKSYQKEDNQEEEKKIKFSFWKWFTIVIILSISWYIYKNLYFSPKYDDKNYINIEEKNIDIEEKNIDIEKKVIEDLSSYDLKEEEKIELIQDSISDLLENKEEKIIESPKEIDIEIEKKIDIIKEDITQEDKIKIEIIESKEEIIIKQEIIVRPKKGALWFGMIDIKNKKKKILWQKNL